MDQTCPGKTLLRVVGILMIVFASISIIMSCFTLFAGGVATVGLNAVMEGDPVGIQQLEGALTEAGVTASDMHTYGIVTIVVSVLFLVSAVFELILGILGTKNAGRPEKAKTLLVLGIISLVFATLSLFGGLTIASVIGLILPLLYTIGAAMNRKAA